MKKKLKRILLFMIMITVCLVMKEKAHTVGAYAITDDNFYFVGPNGAEYENNALKPFLLNTPFAIFSLCAKEDAIKNTDEFTWSTSDPNIATVSALPNGDVKITRTGPGYARISVTIKRDTGYIYKASFLIFVDVKIKTEESPDRPGEYTKLYQVTTNEKKGMILYKCSDPTYQRPAGKPLNTKEKIYLEYTSNPEVVAGTLLKWESGDDSVATVSNDGTVTAVGAGSTVITITTNTMEDNKPTVIQVPVYVNPLINTNVFNEAGKDNWTNVAAITAASEFTLSTNASHASNLKWVVQDLAGNTLDPESSKVNWSASDISNTFSFHNAKVGVYKVYAYVSEDFDSSNQNVEFLNLTIIVPFEAPSSVTMNVSDTYDLVENLNMANGFTSIKSDNANIVEVNQATGVMKAKATGETKVRLQYDAYENGVLVSRNCIITVRVIDALALNLSDATIYVAGEVKLEATVTDPTVPLTWTSSDPTIATVEDGKVVGMSRGDCIITVSTKINGVKKTASCNIKVLPAVSNISIDPKEVAIDIDEYKTLNAQITPSTLNNAELKWVSSDEDVVIITEHGKKFATIKGVKGGTAVITAINQSNVIVGFCKVTVKQPVTSIVLSDKEVLISLREGSFQLRASVLPSNATDQRLKFTSTNSSIARVDDEGKVTLVSAGTVAIIVTSVDSPAVTATCNVTITMPVTGLVLDNTELSMVVGEVRKLTYSILPASASNQKVKFTSSDSSVCTVADNGNITGVKAGSAIVTVTTEDGKFVKTCNVKVSQLATGVSFDVSELTLGVKETKTLKVILSPTGSNSSYTFASTNNAVATVSDSGRVTGVASGTAIIMVTTSNGKVATCTVKVQQRATGIELNFTKKTIAVGDKYRLKATVLPKNASNQKVTFTSSNTKVATISSNGTITAKKGGTTIITAKSVDQGFVTHCVVTVKELITEIKLNSTYRVKKGKTYTIVPKVNTTSVTNKKLKWTSSNTKIATVNQNGKVTGKAYGTVTITVKSTDGSGAKATCKVRVICPATSVTLNYALLNMYEGSSKTLKAKVNPANATYKSVKWSSSDENIAIVSEKGKVTAISEGRVTITATTKDGTKKKAKCIINVSKKVPSTSITVAEQSLVMISGESRTVQTVISPVNSTDGYSWSSDNNAVATVDKKTGRIRAKAIGTAVITVMTDSGKTARITITVVGLNKTSLRLEQYTTYTLWVDGVNPSNIKWDVENPAVATVENGVVTARAVGTTNIIATVNGRRLYCRLVVTKIK